MREATGRVQDCASVDDLVSVIDAYNEIMDYIASQYTVAMIHSLMQPESAAWAAELKNMTEYAAQAGLGKSNFVAAVEESAFAKEPTRKN